MTTNTLDQPLSLNGATPAAARRSEPGHVHTDEVSCEDLARALNTRTPVWKPALAFAVVAAGLGALVATGAIPKIESRKDLRETNARLLSLGKRVQLGAIREAPETRTITLPASLQPDAQATLFAQATGYVRERHADIGDRVKAGDLLAVIDIPLVEEDLNRARAAYAQAEAARAEVDKTRALAKLTLERWRKVDPPGAVSQQEIDERTSAYEAADAAYAAADAVVATRRAEIQGLERRQAFSRVVAPFDGTITARNIEVGDYISSAGPSGLPLFSIANTATLRVYVDVPQVFASAIKPGQRASVLLRGMSGASIEGAVTRTSGALHERSRTLRVEVTVPNDDGRILAGAYGQVRFDVPQLERPIIVPGSALLVRAEGPRVAIVDDAGAIRYIPVTVGRDLGTEVEIIAGLTGKERVVVNMADEIPEGSAVQTVEPASAPAAGK